MRKRLRSFVVALCVAHVALGCSSHHTTRGSGPRVYPLPSSPDPGPSDAWILPPEVAEAVLSTGEIELRSPVKAPGGVTGAIKVELYASEYDLAFAAKWKVVPSSLDSWNNSPRRELAAYEAQKLFLEPADYVVPATGLRCVELQRYREIFGSGSATFEDSRCVLGELTLWLQNVTLEPQLLDEERFVRDPNYAYHLANFNVLTFLIGHKDGRSNNFLVSKNDADRRVFSIDNGISFDAWIWNYFVPNWDSIRVPAVSATAIDRLRQVTPEQIRGLETVAELRVDSEGIYRLVDSGPNLDEESGARMAPGMVQFGLTEDEVEDVQERIEDLLEMVDSGELPVF